MKRKEKRKSKAFGYALAFTLMGFMFLYGMGTAYVNSRNAYYKEPIELLEIHRTGYDTAEIVIAGEEFTIPVIEDLNATAYTLIPPTARLIYGGLYYLDDLIFGDR